MNETSWDQWDRGIECPFEKPRAASNEYWDFIAALSVSSLYLHKNQTYRGYCLLILDIRHATRIDQLTLEEWKGFCTDLYRAEKALMSTLNPDHINLEIMGNVVPHLHWQIVPRYRNDPRWQAPIWTTTVAEMTITRLSRTEQAELTEKLRNALHESIDAPK